MKHFVFALTLLTFTSAIADEQKSPFTPPSHKPIEVEVQHASELANTTLRGMKAIPKIATGVEFVANTLSAFRVFRAAGKGARFGGTVLGKLSPAAPFITAWFVANAPLDIAEHRLNKRVANAALNEAIAKADRLLSLNDSKIEILYDGDRYTRAEIITYFRTLQKDLMTKDPEWDDAVIEAVKAAVPIPFLFENDTAEREYRAASGLALLAQAIQDLIASTAPKIIDKARVNDAETALAYWTKVGEDLRERYFEGLQCNVYVTCKEAGLDWSKHKAEIHGKKVSVDVPTWTKASDPTGENRYRMMSDILAASSNLERHNWGCVRNEFFGRVSDEKDAQAKINQRVYAIRDEVKYLYSDGYSPKEMDLRLAIRNACSNAKNWDGTYYVQYSSYQVLGTEPFRAVFEGKKDLRVMWSDFAMANPKVPELMSKAAGNARKFDEFVPKYDPPQMRAR